MPPNWPPPPTTAAALLLPRCGGSSAVALCRPRAYGFTTRWWTMWWSIPTRPCICRATRPNSVRSSAGSSAAPPTPSRPCPWTTVNSSPAGEPWSCGPTVSSIWASAFPPGLEWWPTRRASPSASPSPWSPVPRAACRWRGLDSVQRSTPRPSIPWPILLSFMTAACWICPSWARRRLTATAT